MPNTYHWLCPVCGEIVDADKRLAEDEYQQIPCEDCRAHRHYETQERRELEWTPNEDELTEDKPCN